MKFLIGVLVLWLVLLCAIWLITSDNLISREIDPQPHLTEEAA